MEKEYICETKIGTWQDRLNRSVENLRVELKFFDCKILRIALFLSSYFLLPYSDIQYCNITLRGYVQFSFFFRERHKLAMLQNRPLREIPFGINGSWGNWIKLPIMCANNLFYSQILLILPPPSPRPQSRSQYFTSLYLHILYLLQKLNCRPTRCISSLLLKIKWKDILFEGKNLYWTCSYSSFIRYCLGVRMGSAKLAEY